MGWWISLENKRGKIYNTTPHSEGGVITLGGSNEATMSLTWNYSKYYYQYIDAEEGLRWINGKTAKETLERLITAKNILIDDPSDNYWAETPGNAGHALAVLVSWAKQHPKGIWRVS